MIRGGVQSLYRGLAKFSLLLYIKNSRTSRKVRVVIVAIVVIVLRAAVIMIPSKLEVAHKAIVGPSRASITVLSSKRIGTNAVAVKCREPSQQILYIYRHTYNKLVVSHLGGPMAFRKFCHVRHSIVAPILSWLPLRKLGRMLIW